MNLLIDGKRKTIEAGWNRLGDYWGVHYLPRVGLRFVTSRGIWRSLRVEWDDGAAWEGSGYLPPRAILSLRPTSPPPTMGLLRPFGEAWYSDGPGGFGIDPCGEGGLLEHDSIAQRSPVGLYDMATGALRSNVPTRGGYNLERGWTPQSTLPAAWQRRSQGSTWG